MECFRSRTAVPTLFAALLLTTLTTASETVAVVEGRTITRNDIYEELPHQVRQEALQRMVGRILVEKEIQRRGVTVSAQEIEAGWEKREAEYRKQFGDEASFGAMLRQQYRTSPEEFKQKVIRFELALDKLVGQEMSPDDGDLFHYYFANRDKYTVPEAVHISHILLRVKPRPDSRGGLRAPSAAEWARAKHEALKLREQLDQGADFATLARQHSDDSDTADQGGQIGFLPRNSKVDELLVKTAFELRNGEVSDPIKTVLGIHILRRNRHRPEKVRSFSEVKPQVRQDYIEYIRMNAYQHLVLRLIEQARRDGRLTVAEAGY